MTSQSSIQKLPPFEASTIFCQRLVVLPPTTSYKWSTFRDPNVMVIGAIDVAKTTNTDGAFGVLGEPTFVVGSDAGAWQYIINMRSVILAGMAAIGFRATNVGLPHVLASDLKVDDPTPGAIFMEQLAVEAGDIIQFNLDAAGVVTMAHEVGDGRIITTKTYDLVALGYEGQIARFGVSSTPGYQMIVKLMKDVAFSITTQQDGKSVMHATVHNIVDFSVADIYANDPEAPPPGGGGSSITNPLGGATVECFDDGHVGTIGGVAYTPTVVPAVPEVLLSAAWHLVQVDNPTTDALTLPAILGGSVAPGTEYIIQRTTGLLAGETWRMTALTLNTSGGDTFDDGSTALPIQPTSQARVTAGALGVWYVG